MIPQDVLVALGATSNENRDRVYSRLEALYEAGYIELMIEKFRVVALQARDGWDDGVISWASLRGGR